MARFRLFGGTDPSRAANANSVVVIGLGRFGESLALELMSLGVEVLGIDKDEDIVQGLNGELTHVVRGDATREETLRELSVGDFDRAVVAIGTDIEASLLVTSLLMQLEVPEVWAKAVTDAHGRILRQLGTHHVVQPEKDMGSRVAHLVQGRMQDYVEIGDGFAIAKMRPPAELVDRALGESEPRSRHGVTVTGYQRGEGEWSHASPDTVLAAGDTILVIGPVARVESFSQLAAGHDRPGDSG